MHIVTLPDRVEFNRGLTSETNIEPGEYITEGIVGANLIRFCGDGSMRPLTEERPFDKAKDWNGKKILVMRFGGFGDITSLTPVIREIKRRWPTCEISVASMGDYASVLEGLPYAAKPLRYPIALGVAQTFDAWIFLEGTVEKNPKAKTLHMTDLFADVIGLGDKNWTADKQPDYAVSKDEATWANVQFPRKPGIRRLCIQVSASARCRVWPMYRMVEFLGLFRQKESWEIFLMGEPSKIAADESERIVNLSSRGATFRQSCAVVATADCVLVPDSAFAHIAGALGVPAVALYGPFPWKLRTAYSPSVTSIQGKGSCSPCFFHEKDRGPLGKDMFPKNCPSRDKYEPGVNPEDPRSPRGFCEVLASIEPKRVVALVEKIARKFELTVV